MRRLRRFLLTRRNERGYTLIEMMIAMALLSLVIAAAFGVVNVMSNQAMTTTDRFTAEGEAQTIADRITKDLRTAVAPTSLTAAFASAERRTTSMFYASLDRPQQPRQPRADQDARLRVVGGWNQRVRVPRGRDAARHGVVSGNYTYTTSPINRIDGKYLDTSQPIFSYYTATDPVNAIPIPITTLTGLRSIDSVGINAARPCASAFARRGHLDAHPHS